MPYQQSSTFVILFVITIDEGNSRAIRMPVFAGSRIDLYYLKVAFSDGTKICPMIARVNCAGLKICCPRNLDSSIRETHGGKLFMILSNQSIDGRKSLVKRNYAS